MVSFEAEIQKFIKNGEKSGWHHVRIPDEALKALHLPNKKSFYIKGHLDDVAISYQAVFPVGDGEFIIPIKKSLLAQLQKSENHFIWVSIEVDTSEYIFNENLLLCLNEDIKAKEKFLNIKLSERKYYSKWVDAAKTADTQAKRIAKIIYAMHYDISYPDMLKLK